MLLSYEAVAKAVQLTKNELILELKVKRVNNFVAVHNLSSLVKNDTSRFRDYRVIKLIFRYFILKMKVKDIVELAEYK